MTAEVGIGDIEIGTWLIKDPVHPSLAQRDKRTGQPLVMYVRWPSGAKSPWLLVQGCFDRT